VLTALIDNHREDSVTRPWDRELTSIESTPERSAALGWALEELIKVGLAPGMEGGIRMTLPSFRPSNWGSSGCRRSLVRRARTRRSSSEVLPDTGYATGAEALCFLFVVVFAVSVGMTLGSTVLGLLAILASAFSR
jgi:hypothetical protein